MTPAGPLLNLAILGVVGFSLAGLLIALGRQLSAARRCLLWRLAFVVLAVGSSLALLQVRLPIPILPAPAEVKSTLSQAHPPVERAIDRLERVPAALPVPPNESPEPVSPAKRARWEVDGLIYGLWFLGVAAVAGRAGLGAIHLRGLKKRCSPFGWANEEGRISNEAGGVPVVLGRDVEVPFVAGIFSAVIFVPDEARNWRSEEWRAVLLHELSHLRRGDLGALLFSQFVAALHWFNPLAWLALGQLRREAERAADDEASSGYAAADIYAEDLLLVVRRLSGRPALPWPAVGMARPSEVTQRISQLLEKGRDRSTPSRAWSRGGLVLAAVLAAAGFGLKPVAAQRPPGGEKASDPHAVLLRDEKPLVVLCKDENGRPVPDAEVYLAEQSSRRTMYQHNYGSTWKQRGPVRTDDKGEAVFPQPFVFHDQGYSRVIYARGPGALVGGDFFSEETGEREGGRFVVNLQASGTLQGKVSLKGESRPVKIRLLGAVTEDGKCEFGISGETLPAELLETTADTDGRFVLKHIPNRAIVYLEATAQGYGWAQTMCLPLQRGEISLTLEKEAVIEGTLTDETSRPVAGVRVNAASRESAVMLIPTGAKTDDSGRFRIPGLPGGHYSITLAWTGSAVMQEAKVILRPGEIKTLELVQEKGVEMSGVVMSGSAGIPGVLVAAVCGDVGGSGIDSSKTDDQGRYTLRLPSGKSHLYLASLPEGLQKVSDQAGEIVVQNGQVVSGTKDFVVTEAVKREASKPARVKGSVVDPDGVPLGGILLMLRRSPLKDEGGMTAGPVGTTKADGTFDLELAPNSKCVISAGGVRQSTAKSQEFATSSGSLHELENLVVRPATGTAAGVVVDEAGNPLANAEVDPWSKNKHAWRSNQVVTDLEGRFSLPYVLEDELLSLTVTKPGYSRRQVQGIPSGTQDIRVMLPALTSEMTAFERLQDGKLSIGKPVPEIQVERWIQGEGNLPGFPRQDGRWTLVAFLGVGATTEAKFAVMAKLAASGTVAPIGIFASDVDGHYSRTLLKKTPVNFPLAIDRHVPGRTESTMAGATRMALGNGVNYLIDPQGIVRDMPKTLDDLKLPR